MIRLTVLYNLPEGTDEAEFLRWRLGEHQAENAAMPDVLHTDFGRIDERWTFDNPKEKPPYRFMTIAEWPDRESFEAAFYADSPDDDLSRMSESVFLISEILTSTDNTKLDQT